MGKNKKKTKKPATKTVYRNTPAKPAKSPARRRTTRGGNNGNSTATLIAVGSAALTGFIKGKGIGFPQIPAIGINGTIALASGIVSLFVKPGKAKEILGTVSLIHGSIFAADLGRKLAVGENLLSGEEEISGPGMIPQNMLKAAIPAGMTLIPTSTLQQLQAALEGEEDIEGDEDELEGEEDELEGEEDIEGDEDLEGDEVSGFSVS